MSFIRRLLFLLWMLVSAGTGLFFCLLRPFGVDANRATCLLFSRVVTRLCGVKPVLENAERLTATRPCVFVANHQTSFDLALYAGIMPPRTVVIVKRELLWMPLLGLYLWLSGNILIKRDSLKKSRASIDRAAQIIRDRGVSVWVLPEGTRNGGGTALLPFKKGAFHLAISAGVPIVPIVTFDLRGICLMEDSQMRGGRARQRVLEPVSTRGMTRADVGALCENVRARMEAALAGAV